MTVEPDAEDIEISGEFDTLLGALASAPDLRHARGVRYPTGAVLAHARAWRRGHRLRSGYAQANGCRSIDSCRALVFLQTIYLYSNFQYFISSMRTVCCADFLTGHVTRNARQTTLAGGRAFQNDLLQAQDANASSCRSRPPIVNPFWEKKGQVQVDSAPLEDRAGSGCASGSADSLEPVVEQEENEGNALTVLWTMDCALRQLASVNGLSPKAFCLEPIEFFVRALHYGAVLLEGTAQL